MNLKRYKKLPLSARQAGISGETSLSTHVAGLGGASQRHGCSGVRPCLVSRKGTRDREEDPLGGWVGQSGRERDGAVKGRGRWAGSEGWGAGAHFPHPEAVRESCFLLSRDDPLVPISLRIAIPSRMSEAQKTLACGEIRRERPGRWVSTACNHGVSKSPRVYC